MALSSHSFSDHQVPVGPSPPRYLPDQSRGYAQAHRVAPPAIIITSSHVIPLSSNHHRPIVESSYTHRHHRQVLPHAVAVLLLLFPSYKARTDAGLMPPIPVRRGRGGVMNANLLLSHGGRRLNRYIRYAHCSDR